MSEDELKLAAKIERRVKEREKICAEISVVMDGFAKSVNKLLDHDLKTYSTLSRPDALFFDSPISHYFTDHWIKEEFMRLKLAFAGKHLDGNDLITPFAKRMEDANKWILKFTKEPEKPKSGIEAIVFQEEK